jgi:hypothetical protein
MPKLVITTDHPLEIGKRYSGLTDPQTQMRPDQSALVVRESTREEYVECLVSYGWDREWMEILSTTGPYVYFYDILTD